MIRSSASLFVPYFFYTVLPITGPNRQKIPLTQNGMSPPLQIPTPSFIQTTTTESGLKYFFKI